MAAPKIPPFLGAGDFTYRGDDVPRFVAASGCCLTDSEGRVYLDGEAANGTVPLGYDPELLETAVIASRQLPALPSFCESELRLDVARRLAERVSAAAGVSGRVSFELGGAQGMELAMKVVAANRGWRQVVTLQGGYHGRSPFTATLSASARYRSLIPVAAGEIVRLPYPDPDDPASAGSWLEHVRRLGSDLSGVDRSQVSAFVLEPLLNVGGMALPAPGHVAAAAAHFREKGALVVVDEIFTGFHRTGPSFGFELHGLQPDIVVMSKALTNGIAALSAIWAREPLLDATHFPPGSHSSTFAGTPFMLQVAGEVLRRLEDARAWTARAEALQRRLAATVAAALERFPGFVRSGSAIGAIARLRLSEPLASRVRHHALSPATGRDDGLSGLLLASTGMAPDVVAAHPPLTISDDELDQLDARLIDALAATEREDR